MITQPDALRLADELDNILDIQKRARCAAVELRRLSRVETELLAMRSVFSEAGCTFDVIYIRRLVRAEAQRDELLVLLNEVRMNFTRDDDLPDDLLPRIDAAIAKVEGQS